MSILGSKRRFTTDHLRLDIPSQLTLTAEEQYSPVSRFREKRLRSLLVPLLERLSNGRDGIRILDVGGAEPYWRPIRSQLKKLKCHITIANLNEEAAALEDSNAQIDFICGDARNLDFPDGNFDLVHSNSVIEHVGTWLDIRAMAGEVRRLAPAYFVQTPNFWFPYEPHYGVAFFHWLPEQIRARWMTAMALKTWPKAPSLIEATEWVQRAYLLDCAQMRALLPDATINREKLFGLTKSLIAIRYAT